MQHQNLQEGKWFRMSLAEQLGNVGSEYSRVVKNTKEHKVARAESARARYFELLDLTKRDPRWNIYRKRELSRLREITGEDFSGNLQQYFDRFALLVR